MKRPIVDGLYRHYKGEVYKVVAIAERETDGELQIVYRRERRAFVRPLSEWETWVSRPDGILVRRFTRVE